MVSIIVAVARNGIIGRDGDLPWRLSADLQRFKKLTMGKTIIMGRKTFESIGRLLPGRKMVVLTRQKDWTFPGVHVYDSLPPALAKEAPESEELFVIGGAQLYAAALPLAERLYMTTVEADSKGDTIFPEWDPPAWHEIETRSIPADENNEFATTFRIYERKVS